MTASSVGTFLDVRQSVGSETRAPAPRTDPDLTTRAATVLATINDGAHALDEMREKTGLPVSDLVAALSWLERAGLVTLTDAASNLRADLTPEAAAALR